MKDVKIGNIRPIAEPRTLDKAARKEPAGSTEFSQSLEKAVDHLAKLQQQPAAAPVATDTKSLLAAAEAERQRFESAMRGAEQLRQLHQNITQKPSQDES